MTNNSQYIQYATHGTCSKMIGVEIENDIIKNIEITTTLESDNIYVSTYSLNNKKSSWYLT